MINITSNVMSSIFDYLDYGSIVNFAQISKYHQRIFKKHELALAHKHNILMVLCKYDSPPNDYFDKAFITGINQFNVVLFGNQYFPHNNTGYNNDHFSLIALWTLYATIYNAQQIMNDTNLTKDYAIWNKYVMIEKYIQLGQLERGELELTKKISANFLEHKAIYSAAKGGHDQSINYIIKYYSTDMNIDYITTLYKYGHYRHIHPSIIQLAELHPLKNFTKIIKFLVKTGKFAKTVEYITEHCNFDTVTYIKYICRYNYKAELEFIVKVKNLSLSYYEEALIEAVEYGNTSIIEFLKQIM